MIKFTRLFKELAMYTRSLSWGLSEWGVALTTHFLLEPELSMCRAIPVLLSAPLPLLQIWNGTGIGYLQPAKWWTDILSWEHIWSVDHYVVNRRFHVLNKLNWLDCGIEEGIIDVSSPFPNNQNFFCLCVSFHIYIACLLFLVFVII